LRRLAVGEVLREALRAFLIEHGRDLSQEVSRDG
jgi:hypothetical protein